MKKERGRIGAHGKAGTPTGGIRGDGACRRFCSGFLCMHPRPVSAAIIFIIIAYILAAGVPHLSPELFAFKYNSENVSMMPAIINTVIMMILALLAALPAGIFSGDISDRICETRQ